MNLVSLLIALIVIGFVAYLIWWVISQIPLPAPFNVAVRVVFGLIVVLVILELFFGGGLGGFNLGLHSRCL